jgi:hypothetical protein
MEWLIYLKFEFFKVRYTCCLTKPIIITCGEHSLHVDFRFIWILNELPLHSLHVDLYLLWIQKALPPHTSFFFFLWIQISLPPQTLHSDFRLIWIQIWPPLQSIHLSFSFPWVHLSFSRIQYKWYTFFSYSFVIFIFLFSSLKQSQPLHLIYCFSFSILLYNV